jgi:hypothetical protein
MPRVFPNGQDRQAKVRHCHPTEAIANLLNDAAGCAQVFGATCRYPGVGAVPQLHKGQALRPRMLSLLAVGGTALCAMLSICSTASAAKLPSVPPQSQMLGQAFLNKPVSFGTVTISTIGGRPLDSSA